MGITFFQQLGELFIQTLHHGQDTASNLIWRRIKYFTFLQYVFTNNDILCWEQQVQGTRNYIQQPRTNKDKRTKNQISIYKTEIPKFLNLQTVPILYIYDTSTATTKLVYFIYLVNQ